MSIGASPIPVLNPEVMISLSGNTLRVLAIRKPKLAVYHGSHRNVQLAFQPVDGGFAGTCEIYDSEFDSTLVVEIDGTSIVLRAEIGVFFVDKLPEARELSTIERYEETFKARRSVTFIRNCAESSRYRQRPFSDGDMGYMRDKLESARAGISSSGISDELINDIYLPGIEDAINRKDTYNIIRLSACLIHRLTIDLNAD